MPLKMLRRETCWGVHEGPWRCSPSLQIIHCESKLIHLLKICQVFKWSRWGIDLGVSRNGGTSVHQSSILDWEWLRCSLNFKPSSVFGVPPWLGNPPFLCQKPRELPKTQPPKELCHAVAAMGFTVVRLPFSSEMLRVERVPPGRQNLCRQVAEEALIWGFHSHGCIQ